ncbi:MAG: VWA domain-containing protein [Acidobacteria bacterium]|nr:VWA domain-containing protein [Acidobacteriota bacterium]
MKLQPNRPQGSVLLIISFLALPLLAVSPGAARRSQQKSAAATQATSAAAPEARKFIVTVIGPNGGFISGLTRDSFAVFEGKSQREISYFKSDDVPVSVGLLVDVSGSVRRQTVEAAKRVAMRFIEQSHPENEYFIGEFGRSLRGLTGWTRDPRTIAEALGKVGTANGAKPKPDPQGPTALYDSCVAALGTMASGTHPKRVIVLISDAGGDNESEHSFNDLKRRIRESDVLIYAIGITGDSALGTPDILGQAVTDELTSLSGGRAYFIEREKEAGEAVKRLTVELRHQYEIGFTPTNAARGGKWNKVKIKVTLPDPSLKNIVVRSRDGYFSTTPAP